MNAVLLRTKRWPMAAFVGLAIVLICVLRTRSVSTHGDDAMYASAMASHSLWNYVEQRYLTWSGRLLIDATTVLLMNHVMVWRALTGLLLLLAAWLVAWATRATRDGASALLACTAIFLSSPSTMYGAVWWMTGSFNYLWVWVAGLIAFVPFARPASSPLVFFVAWLAAIYAGSHEQGGLLLLGFQSLAMVVLVRDRQFRWPHGLVMVTAAIGLATVVFAPGTAQRFNVVTVFWFPQYLEWTLVERGVAGLDLAFGHAFRVSNVLAGFFYVILAIRVFQQVRDPIKRAIAVVPLAVYLVPMVLVQVLADFASVDNGLARMWSYQYPPGRTGDGYEPFGLSDYTTVLDRAFYGHFWVVACGVMCALTSAANAAIASPRFGRAMPLAVFAAAIASSAILGMSPTLYASGQRIFFFQDALLAGLAVAIFAELEGVVLKRLLMAAALALAGLNLWAVVSRTVQ